MKLSIGPAPEPMLVTIEIEEGDEAYVLELDEKLAVALAGSILSEVEQREREFEEKFPIGVTIQ